MCIRLYVFGLLNNSVSILWWILWYHCTEFKEKIDGQVLHRTNFIHCCLYTRVGTPLSHHSAKVEFCLIVFCRARKPDRNAFLSFLLLFKTWDKAPCCFQVVIFIANSFQKNDHLPNLGVVFFRKETLLIKGVVPVFHVELTRLILCFLVHYASGSDTQEDPMSEL